MYTSVHQVISYESQSRSIVRWARRVISRAYFVRLRKCKKKKKIIVRIKNGFQHAVRSKHKIYLFSFSLFFKFKATQIGGRLYLNTTREMKMPTFFFLKFVNVFTTWRVAQFFILFLIFPPHQSPTGIW